MVGAGKILSPAIGVAAVISKALSSAGPAGAVVYCKTVGGRKDASRGPSGPRSSGLPSSTASGSAFPKVV